MNRFHFGKVKQWMIDTLEHGPSGYQHQTIEMLFVVTLNDRTSCSNVIDGLYSASQGAKKLLIGRLANSKPQRDYVTRLCELDVIENGWGTHRKATVLAVLPGGANTVSSQGLRQVECLIRLADDLFN